MNINTTTNLKYIEEIIPIEVLPDVFQHLNSKQRAGCKRISRIAEFAVNQANTNYPTNPALPYPNYPNKPFPKIVNKYKEQLIDMFSQEEKFIFLHKDRFRYENLFSYIVFSMNSCDNKKIEGYSNFDLLYEKPTDLLLKQLKNDFIVINKSQSIPEKMKQLISFAEEKNLIHVFFETVNKMKDDKLFLELVRSDFPKLENYDPELYLEYSV